MVGDALSHAVLPGIVLSFLLTNCYHPLLFFGGALCAGLLATLTMESLAENFNLNREVATGLTFTTFFALGLFLMCFAKQADLDPECVLYGDLIGVPFDCWSWKGTMMGPKAPFVLLLLLLANGSFLFWGYRALLLTSFDPNLAQSLGLQARRWNQLLMIATTLTSLFAFRIVGAPIVVALFVIPPATAFLLTDNLAIMLGLTLVVDFLVTLNGHGLALLLHGSIPAAMTIFASLLFGLAYWMIPTCKEKKLP